MRGVNALNGKALDGLDHLKQSIRDILTTPIGTRVMRRTYGSRLFQLTDAPLNQSTLVELYSATADAIRKWEKRITVSSVRATSITSGKVNLELIGTYQSKVVKFTVTV